MYCICNYLCTYMYNGSHLLSQVDVLESQFSELLDRVNSTHDFESIKHAHESFVTAIQSQLFLSQQTVSV